MIKNNFTFNRESIVFLSGVVNGRCWYSSLSSRTLGQLLTGRWCTAEPAGLILRPKLYTTSVPNGGPGLFFWIWEERKNSKMDFKCCFCVCVICVSMYRHTSTAGKSCQLRFLRLGGVISGFCLLSNHWDHTLWWLGFRIVMPNSSGTDTPTNLTLLPG